MLALVALGTAWAGGWPFALLWLAAGIAVFAEWVAMTRPGRASILVAIGGAGLVCGSVLLQAGAPVALAGAACLAALAALVVVAPRPGDRGWAASGFLYAAAVAWVPVALRAEPALGAAAILWMFAVVWATDVAAYFTGRALGGPKLWPAVSPRKTWSGFAGGLAAASLAGSLVGWAAARNGCPLPLGAPALLLLSGLASVASQAGDLFESALKRRADVKDSGALIPGHGGVMDRLDGFAAVCLLAGLLLAGFLLAGGRLAQASAP